MHKKIALACATLATAGLLMTGCYGKGDTSLRKEVYQKLSRLPENSYAADTKERRINVKIPYSNFNKCFGLEVEIIDKGTGDTLTMTDWEVFRAFHSIYIPSTECWNGVDEATYNGIRNGTEGMDKRFDEALRISKPKLEEKIKELEEKIDRIKENTKL